MNGIREKFSSVIRAHTRCGDILAVAVSGGADSMCLLSMCLTSPLIKKDNLLVVSIDHKIRGENSANDVKFVSEFCRKNKVRFKSYAVDVPKLAEASGNSLETEARVARYKIFLEQVIGEQQADKVLTAHHASDNVESILMHLFRGSGLNGLCGMEYNREGFYLRPLLDATRDEIDGYMKESNIPFVVDATNADSRYTRNFIRNEILPRIKEKYPGVENAVLRVAEDADSARAFIEHALDPNAYGQISQNTVKIRTFYLSNPVTAAAYIRNILPAALVGEISRAHILAVVALKDAQNGTGVDLPCRYRAQKEYEFITVYRVDAPEKNIIAKKFTIGESEFSGIKISVVKEETGAKGKVLRFDLKEIPDSAVFRFRQDGDIFKPYGGGTKKLKEYLIDQKLPVRIRDSLVCIADGKEILAVVGVEISDKIKVKHGSEIYWLTGGKTHEHER